MSGKVMFSAELKTQVFTIPIDLSATNILML